MLLQGLVLEPGLRLYALGDVQAEVVQRHPRLIPDCPEEREAVVDSSFDSFSMGMGMGGGAGFGSVFGWGNASFRSSAGVWESICAFQLPTCLIFRVFGSIVALGSTEVPVNQSENNRSVAF